MVPLSVMAPTCIIFGGYQVFLGIGRGRGGLLTDYWRFGQLFKMLLWQPLPPQHKDPHRVAEFRL